MGLFQQKSDEEENQWVVLPSEPLERSEAEVLDTAPDLDPLALGLGAATSVSSITLPVPPASD